MTVDWISWLRSDVWFHPRTPADTTQIDLLHPTEATHALQVMEHHAGPAARALCSHAMRNPAPDGAGTWWPRTPTERRLIRANPREWIATTPLAAALRARAESTGEASIVHQIAVGSGLPKALTWGELRRIAMRHPSDALVITATDAEGNGFAPVIGVEMFAHFVAGRHPSTSEVAGRRHPGSRSCIVLWPSDDPRFSCELLTATPTPPPSTGKVQP